MGIEVVRFLARAGLPVTHPSGRRAGLTWPRSGAYWAGNRYADSGLRSRIRPPRCTTCRPRCRALPLCSARGLRRLPDVGEAVRFMGQSWRWAWEYGVGNRKLCWVHIVGDTISSTFTLSDAEADRVRRSGLASADLTGRSTKAQRTGPVRWCWLELDDRRAIESYLRFARHKAEWLAECPAPHRAPRRARGRKHDSPMPTESLELAQRARVVPRRRRT